MLGRIRTVAFISSVCAKLRLYKSLVLPVLEYRIPAWFPQTRIQEESPERIQRRATRFILGQQYRENVLHSDRLLLSRRKCFK